LLEIYAVLVRLLCLLRHRPYPIMADTCHSFFRSPRVSLLGSITFRGAFRGQGGISGTDSLTPNRSALAAVCLSLAVSNKGSTAEWLNPHPGPLTSQHPANANLKVNT
jgi:hypothetical protein